jgi:hypothetical protein
LVCEFNKQFILCAGKEWFIGERKKMVNLFRRITHAVDTEPNYEEIDFSKTNYINLLYFTKWIYYIITIILKKLFYLIFRANKKIAI